MLNSSDMSRRILCWCLPPGPFASGTSRTWPGAADPTEDDKIGGFLHASLRYSVLEVSFGFERSNSSTALGSASVVVDVSAVVGNGFARPNPRDFLKPDVSGQLEFRVLKDGS